MAKSPEDLPVGIVAFGQTSDGLVVAMEVKIDPAGDPLAEYRAKVEAEIDLDTVMGSLGYEADQTGRSIRSSFGFTRWNSNWEPIGPKPNYAIPAETKRVLN